jgi:hypothetical protein
MLQNYEFVNVSVRIRMTYRLLAVEIYRSIFYRHGLCLSQLETDLVFPAFPPAGIPYKQDAEHINNI